MRGYVHFAGWKVEEEEDKEMGNEGQVGMKRGYATTKRREGMGRAGQGRQGQRRGKREREAQTKREEATHRETET